MIKALSASILLATAFCQAPPGIPAIPAVPSNPAVPAVPTEPAVPLIPTEPAVPLIPTEPAVPLVPTEPAVPLVPTEPAVPLVPTEPAVPLIPTEPAVPSLPSIPIPPPVNTQYVPQTPTQPAVPTTPTQPILPPGTYYGAYGQICAPEPLRDAVCRSAGAIGAELSPGVTKCERAYDCCLCGTVTCGNYASGCITFSAGLSGIKGVKDVQIIGRSEQLGGGEIYCLEAEACADSVITARNIKSIDVSGALAMQNAVITVTNPTADFNFDCVGLGGCENLKLEIIVEGPPPGYKCNPAIAPRLIEWNAFQCSGQESCKNMEVIIRNDGCNEIEIQQMECVLADSCVGTKYEIIGAVTINNCDFRGAVPAGLEMCSGGGFAPGVPQYNPYFVPL